MTTLVGGGTLPVGTILPFAGPSGNVPDGFLLCNGASINRNDFAALFAVIGTHWGNPSGTTFRVPTTQGLLLRGVAYGSGFDEDRNSRTAVQTGGQTGDQVGSFQNDRFQSHRHNFTYNRVACSTTPNSNGSDGKMFWDRNNGSSFPNTVTNSTAGLFRTVNAAIRDYVMNNTGNAQTVGKNVYVNYIIKY